MSLMFFKNHIKSEIDSDLQSCLKDYQTSKLHNFVKNQPIFT